MSVLAIKEMSIAQIKGDTITTLVIIIAMYRSIVFVDCFILPGRNLADVSKALKLFSPETL